MTRTTRTHWLATVMCTSLFACGGGSDKPDGAIASPTGAAGSTPASSAGTSASDAETVAPMQAAIRFLPAGASVPDGVYALANGCSGQLLDVDNASTSDGARIIQSFDNAGDGTGSRSQQWRFTRQTDGSYVIMAMHSGKALDLDQSSSGMQAPAVIQWSSHGGNNQRWWVDSVGNGSFKLHPRSAPDRSLDLPYASSQPGTAMWAWTDNESCAQRWQLRTATPTTGASGRVLHVASNGTAQGDGSPARPMSDIQAAIYQAKPGDTVEVHAGTYRPSNGNWVGVSGTASAPIIIKTSGNDQVIIDLNDMPASASTPYCFSVTGQHIVVQGFECRNNKKAWAFLAYCTRHVTFRGNVARNVFMGGVGSYCDRADQSSNITIEGNHVINVALQNAAHTARGGWSGALSAMRARDVRIVRNRVEGSHGEGVICVLADNCNVADNDVGDTYSHGIYLDNTTRSVVERNFVHSDGQQEYFNEAGSPGAGVVVASEGYSDGPTRCEPNPDSTNPSADLTIRNNIMLNRRWGFFYGNYDCGRGMQQVRVVHNTIYGSREASIYIQQSAGTRDSVFANNIIAPYVGSGYYAYVPSTSGVSFHNNLWGAGGLDKPLSGPGDVIADPRFVAMGGARWSDYRPRADSPAVGAAAAMSVVTDDHTGTARPGTPRVMGGLLPRP